MRNRTLRRDRDYVSLSSAISSMRAKELANYIFVIGLINLKHCKLFKSRDWDNFMARFKELAVKLEVDRIINYYDFRTEISDLIDNMSFDECKDKLMVLVREAYGCKEHEDLYEVAKKLFKASDEVF